MARPATGTIVERINSDGRTARLLRFSVKGKKRSVWLGVVSRAEAERELRLELDRVAKGTWEVKAPAHTFHEFADEWWLLHEGEWAPKTVVDYRWRLQRYLLPFFGELALRAITVDTVERYIAEQLQQNKRIREAKEPIVERYTDKRGRECARALKPLSPRSINMSVVLVGAILEAAGERKLIESNPARGKRRRIKEHRRARAYLESAEQIEALLEAAGELDREATKERKHIERRAMLGVLCFAGLRISEPVALRWRDVDLAGCWLSTGSKTHAGYRKVKIRGALRDELVTLRAKHEQIDQHAYVFPTRSGGRLSVDNVRTRVLGGAVRRANENLEAKGLPPLPERLTPHGLRHTFCSVLYALGEDPGTVMDELGHGSEGLALRVYRHAMRRGEEEKDKLRALVQGTLLDDPTDAGSGQRIKGGEVVA
jgi:integrase